MHSKRKTGPTLAEVEGGASKTEKKTEKKHNSRRTSRKEGTKKAEKKMEGMKKGRERIFLPMKLLADGIKSRKKKKAQKKKIKKAWEEL